MKYMSAVAAVAFAAFTFTAAPTDAGAQGQGKGQGKGQARGQTGEPAAGTRQQGRGPEPAAQGKGRQDRPAAAPRQGQPRGQQPAAAGKGQGRAAEVRAATPATSRPPGPPAHARARFAREVRAADMSPAVRRFATTNRPSQFVAAGAVARGHARGHGEDFRIVPVGEQIRIANRRGDVLLLLDEARARDLGRWQVDILDTPVRAGAPAFCRSGAGHPVWGRQWCLDKDFGLGDFEDFRWGRTTRVDDIVFRRARTGERLFTEALRTVIGPNTFDRLALHAVTLGFTDPLTGRWGSDPNGARVLLVDSGGRPVAEIVDVNRNDRADLLLVALRPW